MLSKLREKCRQKSGTFAKDKVSAKILKTEAQNISIRENVSNMVSNQGGVKMDDTEVNREDKSGGNATH